MKKKGYQFLEKINHINGDYNNPIFGIDSSKIDVASPTVFFTKVARGMYNLTQKKNDFFQYSVLILIR
ncbi:MAG: hypothetical protein L6U99_05940 [Clostridium sp.]|nr:MAG: hypothetical protein L6U99_05940 [Clostridium sp.]